MQYVYVSFDVPQVECAMNSQHLFLIAPSGDSCCLLCLMDRAVGGDAVSTPMDRCASYLHDCVVLLQTTVVQQLLLSPQSHHQAYANTDELSSHSLPTRLHPWLTSVLLCFARHHTYTPYADLTKELVIVVFGVDLYAALSSLAAALQRCGNTDNSKMKCHLLLLLSDLLTVDGGALLLHQVTSATAGEEFYSHESSALSCQNVSLQHFPQETAALDCLLEHLVSSLRDEVPRCKLNCSGAEEIAQRNLVELLLYVLGQLSDGGCGFLGTLQSQHQSQQTEETCVEEWLLMLASLAVRFHANPSDVCLNAMSLLRSQWYHVDHGQQRLASMWTREQTASILLPLLLSAATNVVSAVADMLVQHLLIFQEGEGGGTHCCSMETLDRAADYAFESIRTSRSGISSDNSGTTCLQTTTVSVLNLISHISTLQRSQVRSSAGQNHRMPSVFAEHLIALGLSDSGLFVTCILNTTLFRDALTQCGDLETIAVKAATLCRSLSRSAALQLFELLKEHPERNRLSVDAVSLLAHALQSCFTDDDWQTLPFLSLLSAVDVIHWLSAMTPALDELAVKAFDVTAAAIVSRPAESSAWVPRALQLARHVAQGNVVVSTTMSSEEEESAPLSCRLLDLCMRVLPLLQSSSQDWEEWIEVIVAVMTMSLRCSSSYANNTGTTAHVASSRFCHTDATCVGDVLIRTPPNQRPSSVRAFCEWLLQSSISRGARFLSSLMFMVADAKHVKDMIPSKELLDSCIELWSRRLNAPDGPSMEDDVLDDDVSLSLYVSRFLLHGGTTNVSGSAPDLMDPVDKARQRLNIPRMLIEQLVKQPLSMLRVISADMYATVCDRCSAFLDFVWTIEGNPLWRGKHYFGALSYAFVTDRAQREATAYISAIVVHPQRLEQFCRAAFSPCLDFEIHSEADVRSEGDTVLQFLVSACYHGRSATVSKIVGESFLPSFLLTYENQCWNVHSRNHRGGEITKPSSGDEDLHNMRDMHIAEVVTFVLSNENHSMATHDRLYCRWALDRLLRRMRGTVIATVCSTSVAACKRFAQVLSVCVERVHGNELAWKIAETLSSNVVCWSKALTTTSSNGDLPAVEFVVLALAMGRRLVYAVDCFDFMAQCGGLEHLINFSPLQYPSGYTSKMVAVCYSYFERFAEAMSQDSSVTTTKNWLLVAVEHSYKTSVPHALIAVALCGRILLLAPHILVHETCVLGLLLRIQQCVIQTRANEPLHLLVVNCTRDVMTAVTLQRPVWSTVPMGRSLLHALEVLHNISPRDVLPLPLDALHSSSSHVLSSSSSSQLFSSFIPCDAEFSLFVPVAEDAQFFPALIWNST